MSQRPLIVLLEIAMIAGIALILNNVIAIKLWPQGGSISLVMVPIVILAFRRGWGAGVLAGLIVGLLDLMIAPYIVHPAQVVLDYPLAFAALGMAGVVKLKEAPLKDQLGLIAMAVTFAGALRLAAHFTSGVIWFGQYAPEGFSPVLYSLAYNASYIVPDILLSILVMVVLVTKAPQLVTRPQ
ncbi:energy-coupled thiamine transporter ThiT [Desmospora profundinema]|uniref:Thiamine transporter n=1 Tax=Desmospora profundinema TaxID=1571184 RepID=A0ABU1IU07_9BACL|nr:energy-coupled thiamine transporter ThiT [Desmospora profundinema]MDR6227245.1 thiamine transporter [Desmospora profundinema]